MDAASRPADLPPLTPEIANVVISAVYFGGAPLRILKAWCDGQLELVVTDDILNEYDEIAIVPWGRQVPT